MMSEQKKVCNTCGGSGEIGFFQGESRFFITREECPVCFGVGFIDEKDRAEDSQPSRRGDGADGEDGE